MPSEAIGTLALGALAVVALAMGRLPSAGFASCEERTQHGRDRRSTVKRPRMIETAPPDGEPE
jgi:hypothetical protein